MMGMKMKIGECAIGNNLVNEEGVNMLKLSKKMAYLLFAVSVVADTIAWTYLEACEGFTKTGATIGVIVFVIITWWCFSQTLKIINLAVAYACWTSIGTIATSVIGVVLFHQQLSPLGWASVAGLTAGVILLSLFGTPKEAEMKNKEDEA